MDSQLHATPTLQARDSVRAPLQVPPDAAGVTTVRVRVWVWVPVSQGSEQADHPDQSERTQLLAQTVSAVALPPEAVWFAPHTVQASQ